MLSIYLESPHSITKQMLITELYRDMALSEKACLLFLSTRRVLATDESLRCQEYCVSMVMRCILQKCNNPTLSFQYRMRACQKKVTVREWNNLFHHPNDAASRAVNRLTLFHIMMLLYEFCTRRTVLPVRPSNRLAIQGKLCWIGAHNLEKPWEK